MTLTTGDPGGLEPATLSTVDDGAALPPVEASSPAADAAAKPAPARMSLDDALASAMRSKAQTSASAGDRPRDELGRFARTEAPTDGTRVPAPEKPAEAVPPAAEQPAQSPADLPAAWRKSDRSALWGALPPEARAAIAAREEEVSRGFAAYEGIGPFMRQAAEAGTTLPQALQNYTAAERYLETDPGAALQWLAQSYGVEIEVKGAAAAGGQPAQAMPPQVLQMHQRLDRIEGHYRADAQARSESEVVAFAADPANTHFEAVAEDIVRLLNAGQARTLKEAYETAIWTNPAVRTRLLAEREEASRTAAQKASADAAHKARVASRSIATAAPSSNGVRAAGRKMSLDDALSDALTVASTAEL